jgi:hypothetical protein
MIQCGFGTWILIANTQKKCKIKFIALCWFTHGPRGTLIKKSKKYMSKNIECNILIVG